MFTMDQIRSAVKAKDFAWFDSNKDYDVNIVGIRNTATGNSITNSFDDWITVSYKIDGVWQYHIWDCTTDPGKTHSIDKLLNTKGVAVLVPGQYRSSYKLGLHQGKYKALVQLQPVKVYRDNNRDNVFDKDPNTIEEGFFGINIHRSSPTSTSTLVGGWSAGCQVFANINDYTKFIKIMERSRDIFGNKFTYTLLRSDEIIR